MFINLKIDNAYIFKSDSTYDKFGKHLAEGNNISNLYNYNEFLTRKYAIKHMKKSPEVICLGSSRVMQVNSSIFEDDFFFNMGVSAVSLKEVIASYNVINVKGSIPKMVIIGIDPSFFLKDRNRLREYFQDDFNSIAQEYKLDKAVEIKYSKNKYIELISPIYCIENIKHGSKDISLVDNIFINEPVLSSDGSYIYNIKKRNQSNEAILQEAMSQYDSFFYERFNKKEIDPELLILFRNFIKIIKVKSNVIIFFPPFHPYFADKFNNDYNLKVINEIEQLLKKFAIDQNIEFVGSFKSKTNNYNLESFDFYDGVHPKRETVEMIFNTETYQ